jgi:hypothetical protein
MLLITGTVLAVDALRTAGDPSADLRFYLLFGGTLAGVLVAGFAAWRLLGPIHSLYRRGGLAIVCAFATVLVMLICIPVNEWFGRSGLMTLLACFGLAAALVGRRAMKLRSQA